MNRDLNYYLNNTANQGLNDATSGGNPRGRRKPQPTSIYEGRNILGGMDYQDYGRDITNDDYLPSGYSYESPWDTEELRATRQGSWNKAGKGLLRTAVKAGSEIAKMPGFIGGAIAAPFANEGEGWETMTNNAWIKAVSNFNEHVNDEYLPVYVKKAVKEGNLWDNISSIDFWATEGADGIGYIASMLVPGAALKALGAGNALAKLPGLAGRVSAGTINSVMATTANTLMEASAEAGGAMDNFEKSLDEQFYSGKITYEDYQNKLAQKPMLGRDIFMANVAILLGPNALQSSLLYGKVNPKSFKAFQTGANKTTNIFSNNVVNRTLNGVDDVLDTGSKGSLYNAATGALEMPERTLKRKAGEVALKAITGGLPEAWEELSQSTAEHVFTEKANKGKLTSNLLKDFVTNDWSQAYLETMATTDGQKAMFLGAFLGGGMSGIHKVVEQRRQKAQNQMLVANGNLAIQAFETATNSKELYNEDGSVNNKQVLEKMAALQQLESMKNIRDFAVENNEPKTIQDLQDLAVRQLVYQFALNEESGAASLSDYLESSGKIEEIVNAQIENREEGASYQKLKNKILKVAQDTQDAHQNFMDFSHLFIDNTLSDVNSEQLLRFKEDARRSYISKFLEKNMLEEKLESLNKLRNALLKQGKYSKNSDTNFEEQTSILNKSIQDQLDASEVSENKLSKDTEDYLKNQIEINNQLAEFDSLQYNEVKEAYDNTDKLLRNFWKKDQIKSEFETFKQSTKELNKLLNEAKAQELQEQINKNDEQRVKQLEKVEEVKSQLDLNNQIKNNELDLTDPEIKEAVENQRAVLQQNEAIVEENDDILNGDVESYTEAAQELPSEFVYDFNQAHSTREIGDSVADIVDDPVAVVENKTPTTITVNNTTVVIDTTDVPASEVSKNIEPETAEEQNKIYSLSENHPMTPGIGSPSYVAYLANRKDKTGEPVRLSLNETSVRTAKTEEDRIKYQKAFDIYHSALQGKILDQAEKNYLIEWLPISLNYTNSSQSFSAFPSNVPRMLKFRTNVVDAISKGVPLDAINTTIVYQQRGVVNSELDENGKPTIKSIKDLPFIANELKGNPKNMTFFHVNGLGYLTTVGPNPSLNTNVLNALKEHKGQIFLGYVNNKGGNIPLKLNTGKVQPAEANVLARIYQAILQDSENLRTLPLAYLDNGVTQSSKVLLEDVKKVFTKEIELLGGDTAVIKTQELLDLMINEQSKVNSIMELSNAEGSKFLRVDSSELTLETEESLKQLENVLNGRSRNIQTVFSKESALKLDFNNIKYLNYLIDNKILNTDVKLDEVINITSSKDKRGSELFLSDTITVTNQPQNIKQSEQTPSESKSLETSDKTKEAYSRFQQLNEKHQITPLKGNELLEMFKLTGKFMKVTADEKYYQNVITGQKYERVSNVYGKEKSKEISSLSKTAFALGRKIDSAIRDFFLDNVKSVEDLKKYDISDNIQVLEDLHKGLIELKNYFDSQGETVLTDDIVLYNDTVGVAGATDIITYNKEGEVSIYDIKTMRGNQLATFYSGSEVVKYDDTKFGMSNRESHKRQVSLYRLLANNTFKIAPKNLGIIPLVVSYPEFLPKTSEAKFLNFIPISPYNSMTLYKENGDKQVIAYKVVKTSKKTETKVEPVQEVTPTPPATQEIRQAVPAQDELTKSNPAFIAFNNKMLEDYKNAILDNIKFENLEFVSGPMFVISNTTGAITTVKNEALNPSYVLNGTDIVIEFGPANARAKAPIEQFYNKAVENSVFNFWKSQKNSLPLQNNPKIKQEVPQPKEIPSVQKVVEAVTKTKDMNTINEKTIIENGMNINELSKKIDVLKETVKKATMSYNTVVKISPANAEKFLKSIESSNEEIRRLEKLIELNKKCVNNG